MFLERRQVYLWIRHSQLHNHVELRFHPKQVFERSWFILPLTQKQVQDHERSVNLQNGTETEEPCSSPQPRHITHAQLFCPTPPCKRPFSAQQMHAQSPVPTCWGKPNTTFESSPNVRIILRYLCMSDGSAINGCHLRQVWGQAALSCRIVIYA
jgi:hypothetical protein